MPRHAESDAELHARIAETRTAIADVITRLTKEDHVTRTAIADAAGWTGPYLSQFVSKGEGEKGERKPKVAKMRDLISALNLLAVSHPRAETTRELQAKLAPLMELYEIAPVALGDPSLPIRADAPNYVDRGGIARFIENNITNVASIVIDGPPMSGVTTTLQLACSLLRRHGYEVTEVPCGELKQQFARSASGVIGAIASCIQGIEPEPALSAPVWDVATMVRDALSRYPNGMAFVIDELDALEPDAQEELNSWIRDVKHSRGRGDAAYARTTIWSGFTGNVPGSARDRSWLWSDEAKIIPWFERDDVDVLAASLAPRAVANGATSDWATRAADAAWKHFGGQPQLTHQFLWDRSHDADTNRKPPASGPYKRHLDVLSRAALDLLTVAGTEEVVRAMAEEDHHLPTWAVNTAVVRLGICKDARGTPTCDFYRDNLAGNIAHRINERIRDAKVADA